MREAGSKCSAVSATQIFFAVFFLGACGTEVASNNSISQEQKISFHLERQYTNAAENDLFLDVAQADGYTFQISGDDFDADVTLGENHSIQSVVRLTSTKEGTHSLSLQINQPDGTVFVNTRLTWDYSLKIPPPPLGSFDEKASQDASVNILLIGAFDGTVTEYAISGDIANNIPDNWQTIPNDFIIPVTLSDDDAAKNITLKYRNVYGTEGSSSTLSIIRRGAAPENCSAVISSSYLATTELVVQVSAETTVPLSYHFTGDVADNGEISFTDSTTATAYVTAGDDGAKRTVTLSVKDLAGNTCPDVEFDLVLQKDHVRQGLTIKDDLLWTDDENITILPRFDHFPDDPIEMYIRGGLSDSFAETWIPFAEETKVRLQLFDGVRFIYVKYRDSAGVEYPETKVNIFLGPYVRLQGSAAPFTLSLSNPLSLVSITITGCQETYSAVPYSASYTCNPTGTTVTAAYLLTDGTTVTRSVDVP